VTESDQNKPLHVMFTAVPPHYDRINRVITLGMDRKWRNAAAKTCMEDNPKRILDVACGTGDLILTIAHMKENCKELIGLDYSEPMLSRAREKLEKVMGNKVTFVHGDASKLPFPDAHFDCISISFAFRNLIYNNPLTSKVLSEVLRVLRPGGRFVIVESSQPETPFIRFFFKLYLRCFVYPAGRLLSGNARAYYYLADSASRFYSPEAVKKLLMEAGFSTVSFRPLFFGAAGIHVALK